MRGSASISSSASFRHAGLLGEALVLVSQDAQRVEVYRPPGDIWALRDYGPGEQVELASLDVALDVDAIYADPLS